MPAAEKAAFVSAFIIAFASHLFVYVQPYYGDHGYALITAPAAVGSSGRWLSAIVNRISYFYLMPLVYGLFVSLFLALATVFICKIFAIKNKVGAVIMGAVIVTFPSISNINLFLYDTPNFHLAALLAVLCVFICQRYRWGFLAGAPVLMSVLAIYQAMIGVACVLCVFILLQQVAGSEFGYKKTGTLALRFLLMGILGGVFYALSLFINARFFDVGLIGHRGMDVQSMAYRMSGVRMIAHVLREVYHEFFYVLFSGRQYMIAGQLMFAYALLALLFTFLIISIIIKQKMYRQALRLALFILLILLIPLAANLARFFSDDRTEIRMLFAGALLFVLCIILMEQTVSMAGLLKSSILLCLLFIAFNFIIVNNVYYLQAYFYNQTTKSISTRIAARVEPHLANAASGQIIFIGGIPNEHLRLISNEFTENPGWQSYPLNTNKGSYFIQMQSDSRYAQEVFARNMTNLHGLPLRMLRNRRRGNAIREQVIESNMPVWPMEGAVGVIDDVIVVNFGSQ